MGRSQVARNRRLGRPGRGRGRGAGAKGRGSRDAAIPPQDNFRRYKHHRENKKIDAEEADIDVDMERMAIYDSVTTAYNTVQIDSTHDEEGQFTLDIQKLSQCIEKLDTSVWMRLPDKLAAEYDKRIGKVGGQVKMTVAEMNSCPIVENNAHVSVNTTDRNEDIPEDDEKSSASGSDEDLDSWLDGVIDS